MALTVFVILSLLAFANAGHEETHYSPASSVSYSSFSSGPGVTNPVASEKTIATPYAYSKSYIEPAPIYEPSSEDIKLNTHNSNIIGNSYSTVKNYDVSSVRDGGQLTHSIPTYYTAVHANPIFYHPQSAYSVSPPVVHTISTPTKSVSIPVAYTHTSPLTKTISLPSYSTPIDVKSSGLGSYSTHAVASAPVKTTITYSEAPVVSHMTFSGLGTSYSW